MPKDNFGHETDPLVVYTTMKAEFAKADAEAKALFDDLAKTLSTIPELVQGADSLQLGESRLYVHVTASVSPRVEIRVTSSDSSTERHVFEPAQKVAAIEDFIQLGVTTSRPRAT